MFFCCANADRVLIQLSKTNDDDDDVSLNEQGEGDEWATYYLLYYYELN